MVSYNKPKVTTNTHFTFQLVFLIDGVQFVGQSNDRTGRGKTILNV